MPIDIKYFNSFVLKKTVNAQNLPSPNNQANRKAVFTGLPWNPSDYPAFIVSAKLTPFVNSVKYQFKHAPLNA